MEEKQLTLDEVKQILANAEQYLLDLKARWDERISRFKKNWLFINYDKLKEGAEFILQSLDELIHFVEQIMPEYAGKDKKAIVIMVIERLFDYIISPALPVWLNPFVPKFKRIIIETWIGNMIDFIVAKYNVGLWAKEENGNQETQTT